MNRRSLLAGGASLALAGAPLAASEASAALEPLLALWARRAALLPLFRVYEDDAEWHRLGDLVTAIEREMIATPATTAAGLNVKIRVLESLGLGVVTGCLDGDMLASVLEDAERLAGGVS